MGEKNNWEELNAVRADRIISRGGKPTPKSSEHIGYIEICFTFRGSPNKVEDRVLFTKPLIYLLGE